MSEQETFTFDGFAIIEFMGHRKRAGKVSTAEIGGTFVFRVETATPDGEKLTEVYNASSLYCLTPVTEQVATIVARSINPAPITAWDLPAKAREALRRMDEEERAIEAGEPEHHDPPHDDSGDYAAWQADQHGHEPEF